MKLKIGMRTFKTAAAVGLSVAISYALKFEYPFYAAIACVVVLQIYSKDTVTAGRNRLLGTFAGGLAGCLFAYIPINKSIASFLGIIFLFFILAHLKLNKSMTIGGIVFMRIMVDLNYSQETPILFTYNRMLATAVGIAVAITVNLLLFPYHRTRDNDRRFVLLKTKLFDGLEGLFFAHDTIDLPVLQKHCDTLQGHLEKNTAEYKLFARRSDEIAKMREIVDLYQNVLRHLAIIQELPENCWILNKENRDKCMEYISHTSSAPAKETESAIPVVVYNYHVGRILDCLQKENTLLVQPPCLWTPREKSLEP